MRETMKMMGMTMSAYHSSWFIYCAIIYLFISLLWSAIVMVLFANSSYFLVFIWMYLFMLNLIPIATIIR